MVWWNIHPSATEEHAIYLFERSYSFLGTFRRERTEQTPTNQNRTKNFIPCIRTTHWKSFINGQNYYASGSGILLILFLTYSKQEKNIVLIAQERAMETPRPDDDKQRPSKRRGIGNIPLYIVALKNWMPGYGTRWPLALVKQFRW